MPFCAEEQLLLAIARRELDEGGVDQVRQWAREPLAWDYVLATAFSHGLLPLLHKNLTAAAADLVPGHFQAKLKRESVANSQTALHLMVKLMKAYSMLSS